MKSIANNGYGKLLLYCFCTEDAGFLRTEIKPLFFLTLVMPKAIRRLFFLGLTKLY